MGGGGGGGGDHLIIVYTVTYILLSYCSKI